MSSLPTNENNTLQDEEDNVDTELFNDNNSVVVDDLKLLHNFAKQQIFLWIKFIFNKSSLNIGGQIYQVYIKECAPKLKGIKSLKDVSNKNKYFNFIWKTGTSRGSSAVQSGLSAKRSSIYTYMYNKFQGKFIYVFIIFLLFLT